MREGETGRSWELLGPQSPPHTPPAHISLSPSSPAPLASQITSLDTPGGQTSCQVQTPGAMGGYRGWKDQQYLEPAA